MVVSPHKNETPPKQKKSTSSHVPKIQNDIPRKMASIPEIKRTGSSTPSVKERQMVGALSAPKKIVYTNKINKNWKKNYTHNFLRMAGVKKVHDLKIQTKKSLLKIKDKTGTYLEHIIVSYKKEDGLPFSFEALIDSETGSVVQSWNQTRYEYNKRYSVKAKDGDFEYYGP